MSTDKTISYPLRIPKELDGELQQAADSAGISKQDIARLCLRIGLVDLAAAAHDMPGIIQKIANDQGVSFTAFAASHHEPHLFNAIQTLANQVKDDLAQPSTKTSRKP